MAGITSHPLYEVWRTIKKRTEQRDYKDYPSYGGRGIRMCKEWSESYPVFYEWAMAHGYKKGLTIDRVANNRGYNPGNCRWVSRRTQANNRRSNTRIRVGDEIHTVSQWSRISKVDKDVILDRLSRGWDPRKAIFTETRSYHFHKEGERSPHLCGNRPDRLRSGKSPHPCASSSSVRDAIEITEIDEIGFAHLSHLGAQLPALLLPLRVSIVDRGELQAGYLVLILHPERGTFLFEPELRYAPHVHVVEVPVEDYLVFVFDRVYHRTVRHMDDDVRINLISCAVHLVYQLQFVAYDISCQVKIITLVHLAIVGLEHMYRLETVYLELLLFRFAFRTLPQMGFYTAHYGTFRSVLGDIPFECRRILLAVLLRNTVLHDVSALGQTVASLTDFGRGQGLTVERRYALGYLISILTRVGQDV